MQYMLLIHMDEAAMAAPKPESGYEMSAPYTAYNEALKKAGALIGGERLAPSASAAIVKVRGDRTEVLDGPFADTKEQLGGYYLIDAPDLDAAVKWAARCPGAARGTVEVRQVWQAG
ncbi:MAG: YciI family protein [Rhizobiaceae bacterium]|nr:YciI family protein [Rhizobiaceae bacterium]